MPDTSRTSKAILAILPSAIGIKRGEHQGSRGYVEHQTLRDITLQVARAKSRVLSGYGAIADGTAPSTAILYTFDLPAGEALIDGVYDRAAAIVSGVMIGAGQTVPSYDLAGAAAVVIPDDGDSVRFALVAIPISGALALRAVFGAIAADAAEVPPAVAEIGTALQAAAIANVDLTTGVILARGKVARAGGGVTVTGVNPATDDGLKAEQSVGSLFNLP